MLCLPSAIFLSQALSCVWTVPGWNSKSLAHHLVVQAVTWGTCLFYLSAEAYDVLSDPGKRTLFDQFGEEGLKAGGGVPSGPFAGPGTQYSQMDGDAARRLFEQLFGEFNMGAAPFPFSSNAVRGPTQFTQFFSTGPNGRTAAYSSSMGMGDMADAARSGGKINGKGRTNNRGSFTAADAMRDDMAWEAGDQGANPFDMFGMNSAADSFHQHSQQQRRQQRPDSSGSNGMWGNPQQQIQQVQLQLSLEELYRGCTKRLKVTRHVLDAASGKSLPVQVRHC